MGEAVPLGEAAAREDARSTFYCNSAVVPYLIFLVGVQEQSVLHPEDLDRSARHRKMAAVMATIPMAAPLCQSIAIIDSR